MINKVGFTLIELLITIAILGVLISATALNFSGKFKGANDSEIMLKISTLRPELIRRAIVEEQGDACEIAFGKFKNIELATDFPSGGGLTNQSIPTEDIYCKSEAFKFLLLSKLEKPKDGKDWYCTDNKGNLGRVSSMEIMPMNYECK